MKKKIGFRTNLIVSLLVIVGFLISSVISYQSSYNIAVESTEEISQRTSDLMYNKISNYFSQLIRASQTMAKDQLLVDYLESTVSQEEKERVIGAYLSAYQEEYQYDSIFLVSVDNGNYYTSTGINRTVTEDNEEDSWYYEVLQSKEAYVIDIDEDEVENADDALTVFVDYKIENSAGEVIGVVGVGVRLNSVQSMMEEISIQADGMEVFLVDEAGKIMISQSFENEFGDEPAENSMPETTLEERVEDTEIEEGFFDDEGMKKMREPISNLKGTGDTAQLWNQNINPQKDNYIVARYVSELSWYLIIRKNTETALWKIHIQIMKNLVVTGVLILLLLIIITCVVRSYEKKVTELTRELADKDEMTGCYTKSATGRYIERELKENPKRKYAFFIFDIDNFKHANDEHGHAFGDYVIVKFASTIQKYFGEDAIVGRIGGDEFVVLMPVHDRKMAEKKAREVSKALNQECVLDEMHWEMSASIGIVMVPMDGKKYEELYKNADLALYETKRNGKNGYAVFEQSMKKER